MPLNPRRSNVRRANVTACMRCKARKQRCDQNLPACSNCEVAGVDCVNVDIDGRATPRSYIKNLEDRIAHLERQLISHGITDYDSPSDEAPPLSTEIPLASPTSKNGAEPPLCHIPEQSRPWRGRTAGVPALLMGQVEHLATADTSTDSNGEYQSLLGSLPYETQTALPPRQVASVLADAYFEHCDFFLPVLVRGEALEMLNRLYQDKSSISEVPVQSRFRAMLVFAVATRLLNRKDASFPVSRSEAYYDSAMRLLSSNPTLVQNADLDQLENMALIIQYMFFSANLASGWYLLGFATRMVIEMGLHQDSSDDSSVAPDTLSKRLWVFWAIYSFERILCSVLNRPCSIPEEAINTPLPTTRESDSSRRFAVHMIRHRRLFSEIHHTISQGPAINGASLDYAAWRDGMRQRLQEWRLTVPAHDSSTQLSPIEIFDGCYHNSIILLYLPSPNMPALNDFELAFLAHSAIRAVETYKICFREGKLRFYWRTLHHLFRAGIALVHCVKALRGAETLGDLTAPDLKSSINACSTVLWGMAERHHAGKAYRDMFESISAAAANDSVVSPQLQFDHGFSGPLLAMFTPSETFPFYSIE
ncbi:Transcription factor [Pleurostoma richardsiae]|uniref:Transcription factor n=1 Tax=Pleurostoma richardsiae TaxID=41990 RepID=A0AA38RGC2_9PEZI|nr:Transcription factor [Pleurostoma richardsiae]